MTRLELFGSRDKRNSATLGISSPLFFTPKKEALNPLLKLVIRKIERVRYIYTTSAFFYDALTVTEYFAGGSF